MNNKPFIVENVDRTCNMLKHKKKRLFSPNTFFMGAKKKDPVIKELMEVIKNKNKHFHFNSEYKFLGDTTEWCTQAVDDNKMNLIDGQYIGVKTVQQKPVFIENLMEEENLALNVDRYGLYIPGDQILNRVKFQWFAVMPVKDLFNTNMYVSRQLIKVLGENYVSNEIDEYSAAKPERVMITI
jgi:hypothetical protein